MNASLRLAAAALVAGLGFATSAAASTCSILNFTTSLDCAAPVTGGDGGNVKEAQMNAGTGVFGVTGWSAVAKIEGTSGTAGSTQTSSGDVFKLTYGSPKPLQAGSWELISPFAFDTSKSYAFAIKGSTDNAVYLMDTRYSSGTWNVTDFEPNNKGKYPNLSNITLFHTANKVCKPGYPGCGDDGGDDQTAPVPLPAGGLLLLSGLGAAALVRRRRRTA